MTQFSTAALVALLESGDAAGAEAVARAALSRDRANSEILTLHGISLQVLGRADDAAAAFREALALKPDNFDALNRLALLLLSQRRQAEAIEAYTQAKTRNPGNVMLNFNLAVLLHNNGRADEAVAGYTEVLSAVPDYFEALNGLGVILDHQGKRAEATTFLRRAVEVRPDSGQAFVNLASVLLAEGHQEQAAEAIDRALVCGLNQKILRKAVHSMSLSGLLTSSRVRISFGGSELRFATMAEFVEAHGNEGAVRFPPTRVAEGKPSVNLTVGEPQARAGFDGLEARLLKLEDWRVLPSNIVLAGDTFIDTNNGYSSMALFGHGGMDAAFAVTTRNGKLHFEIKPPRAQRRLEGAVGILAAQPNYSAWLLGELPRLALYDSVAPSLPIILHGTTLPFHHDALAFFGIAPNRVIPVESDVAVAGNHLYYAEQTFQGHNMAFDCLDYLRHIFWARFGDARKPVRSIYVSRAKLGDGAMRPILNEAEVESFFSAEGFDIVHPQNLTFEQQAMAFAGARRIVAPFGAALANGIFCAPGVKLCIIETKRTLEFSRLYHWAVAEVFHVTPGARWKGPAEGISRSYDFTVNIDDLRAFLRVAP